MQLCTPDMWEGIMQQIAKLDTPPSELPQEALTQIYQVQLAMLLVSDYAG